jgi:hypothetical protein
MVPAKPTIPGDTCMKPVMERGMIISIMSERADRANFWASLMQLSDFDKLIELLVEMEFLLSSISAKIATKQVLNVNLPSFKVALELVHVESKTGNEGKQPKSWRVLVDKIQSTRTQFDDFDGI